MTLSLSKYNIYQGNIECRVGGSVHTDLFDINLPNGTLDLPTEPFILELSII